MMTMEMVYVCAGIFVFGIFVGLYIGKCGELRRLRKGNSDNHKQNQTQNNKNNNIVKMNQNKKAG